MLGHKVTPIASKVAGLNETLSGFNLETLDNINNKIDFTKVSSYVKNNDWKIIKNKWKEHIKNMNEKNTESENNDILDIECVYVISLDTEWDEYPYMDTFFYCDTTGGKLSNGQGIDCDIKLRDTDGGYETYY